MAEGLIKDPIALWHVIRMLLPHKARTRAVHDHAFTTASLPAVCELVELALNQERMRASSKATHNRPVAVDPMRRK